MATVRPTAVCLSSCGVQVRYPERPEPLGRVRFPGA